MTSVLLARHLSGLRPIDEAGEKLVAGLGQGEIVKAEVKRPRNIQHHRKFFAMLQIVLQNQDHYRSIDDLLAVCKLRTGHVDVIQTKHGEERVPKSISFAKMDQTAFDAFYDRAVAWVATEVIPGLQRADLDEEVAAELRRF
jgi:hypothetical protein